jgi:hypothetical protein
MDTIVKPARRPRYHRCPTGKRVTPDEREIIWFQKLWEHGPLPQKYLYAYTAHLTPSPGVVKNRLGDLYHEDNTPHGGAYLERPTQQNSVITKYQDAVYEDDAAAELLLKDRGLIPHTSFPSKKTNYHHRFMAACITSSIELACRDAGLTFASSDELLKRAPTGELKVPLTIAHGGHVSNTPLIPDAYFGIRYGDQGVRTFLLEADRENEPITRSNLDQTSYLRKILQYQKLLTRPARDKPAPYHEHFGLKSGMLVLTVTTSYAHMEHILAKVVELIGGRGSPFLLFKVCPNFADRRIVPPVLSELLTTPWRRARHADIDISKP